jgi:integration host factor subunit beta
MSTKKDISALVSRALPEISTDDISYAVEKVVQYLSRSLVNGDRVEIRGFGSLSVRKRKYANQDRCYNTLYYRMSKNLSKRCNDL